MSQPNRAGNVSMVFCRIEGSGGRAIELGVARWGELLAVHHRIMRTILAATQATASFALEDGLMACFVSARSAVGFVIDNHRALAAFEAANPTDGCRVRAGVHTADVAFDDESFSRLVEITEDIVAEANGGEILVRSVARNRRTTRRHHVRRLAVGTTAELAQQPPLAPGCRLTTARLQMLAVVYL